MQLTADQGAPDSCQALKVKPQEESLGGGEAREVHGKIILEKSTVSRGVEILINRKWGVGSYSRK